MGKAIRNRTHFPTAEDEHKKRLDHFIDEIKKGNALLVCGREFELNLEAKDGDELIYDTGDEQKPIRTYYDYVLYQLNADFGTDAANFTELACDRRFYNPNTQCEMTIYEAIRSVVKESELNINDVNPKLRALLATGYFKMVFTTSFDPLVELAMREKWGNHIRVMGVCDVDHLKRDIAESADLNVPTVYYLFGAADDSEQKFVATDNDALEFIQLWQKDMYHSKLLQFTSDKYLLAIGCDYDDWLFRFFWFALRDKNTNLHRGCVSDMIINQSLEKYLKQNKVLTEKNTDRLVDRIIEALKMESEQQMPLATTNYDVFISYARRDLEKVEKLVASLEERGISVWFDRQNLLGEGSVFMEKIKVGITHCRLFVPVLSPTISRQFGEPHPYRLEWHCAENIQIQRSKNYDYCVPVVLDDYDLDAAYFKGEIDSWIKERDAYYINRESDLEKFTTMIQNLLIRKKDVQK